MLQHRRQLIPLHKARKIWAGKRVSWRFFCYQFHDVEMDANNCSAKPSRRPLPFLILILILAKIRIRTIDRFAGQSDVYLRRLAASVA